MATSTITGYIDKYLISVGGSETILCQEVAPSGATCYICQQDTYQGATTDRLVRDCSCRGNSGFAHTRCIVESAITHSNNNSGDWLQRRKGWTECPNCNEGYKNQLGLDLSFRFIGYLKSASIQHQIYARILTLRILTDMYTKIPHNPRYNRLGTKAVQDIIHSMNELKENDMSKQSFIFAKAAVRYNAGQLALIEGTEQSMHIAKGNFMACLDLVKLIGLLEDGEDGIIKFASRGLNAANDFLNSISKATDDDNINSLLQELAIGDTNKLDGDSMDLVTGRYRGAITSIEAKNIKSDHGTLDSINKEWEWADKEDKLNDSSKITPKKHQGYYPNHEWTWVHQPLQCPHLGVVHVHL